MPSKRPKNRKKTLQKKAENLWKDVVKARDKVCQGRRVRGCTDETLQVHHVLGRASKRSFLEIINGVLLCRGCHFFLHQNDAFRMEIEDMVRKRNGFDRLKNEVRQGGAFLEWGRISWLEDKIKVLEFLKKGFEEGIYK